MAARDLVPVLSWLWNRGRCRQCAAAVSIRYPLTELAMAGLFALAALRMPDFAVFWPVAGLAFVLVLLTLIDWQHRILPDGLNLLVASLACFRLGADPALIGPSLATAAGLAVLAVALRAYMSWRLGREALGLGDVKFMAAAGLWLVPDLVPAFLVLAGLGGIGLHLALGRQRDFAFGPALAGALMICVLFAGPLRIGQGG